MKISVLWITLSIVSSAFAQPTNYKPMVITKNTFEKKHLIGFSVNNSWANFRDLKDSTFFRPSLGIHASYDFFFTENLGLNFNFGVQQRGMGIYTRDFDNSIGNPDSTGRLRYRVTTLEAPITFMFRPKKEIFKNTRISAAIGVNLLHHYKAIRVWKSIDDGFHTPIDIKGNFSKFSVPLRASLGLDFNAPGGNLFRSSLIVDYGLKNTYKSLGSTSYQSHKHILVGLQLTFMFL
jgi:hypothetical protein